MNDFDKAAKNVGNRFDLVLVASERMREIHKQRRATEDNDPTKLVDRKYSITPSVQAIKDVEDGKVGREYLNKLRDRSKPRRKNFDPI